ncbi:MAG: DUF5685 family protein [Clostridia bacterium]|nr:DUF5685 family protein [Clostridia bacterium]
MFGYILVNKQTLTEEETKRFSSFYCGLCRALGRRFGTTCRLALSFDMTFLAILLTSLYEPETTASQGRCIVHPNKRRCFLDNTFIDYAADMTILLSYHKALDDWNDERSIAARTRAGMLKSRYSNMAGLYPRQIAAIETGLKNLREIEKAQDASIDPPANAFGQMLGEVFVYRKDVWSDTLRQMGEAIGRFIYLMDAYDDVLDDKRKKSYNPLVAISDKPDFEDKCFEYLTLMIGDGTLAFEKLPLVDDISILRNILYSGVWTKYQALKRERAGKEDKPDAK